MLSVEKMPVILVVLNKNALNDALMTLNLEKANIIAILINDLIPNNDRGQINVGKIIVPVFSFSYLKNFTALKDKAYFLLSGFVRGVADFWKMAKLLMANGISKDHILNFHVLGHISQQWIGNIRYIEKNLVDYFATGISYTEVGLDIDQILNAKGINLSSSNQDLRQGYFTAKYVFEHVKPKSIKFVLIGLAPYSLHYDNSESFSVCTRNLQYIWTLRNFKSGTVHDKVLQILVNDSIKNLPSKITDKQADLNYISIKKAADQIFSAKALIYWEDELKNLTKKFRPEVFERNVQILEDYIKLCLENGARPVAVVWPFAPVMRENYDQNLLVNFRNTLRLFEKAYDFKFVDLFDLPLGYDCFYNMAHLNIRGAYLSSSVLNIKLRSSNTPPLRKVLMFRQMLIASYLLRIYANSVMINSSCSVNFQIKMNIIIYWIAFLKSLYKSSGKRIK